MKFYREPTFWIFMVVIVLSGVFSVAAIRKSQQAEKGKTGQMSTYTGALVETMRDDTHNVTCYVYIGHNVSCVRDHGR